MDAKTLALYLEAVAHVRDDAESTCTYEGDKYGFVVVIDGKSYCVTVEEDEDV